MRDLQIFQYLFDELETVFLQSVARTVSVLINYVAAPLQTALVLYVALTGILMMRGHASEAIGGLISRIIKFSVVLWFSTNGSVYATWVQDFFLTVLPTDLAHAVSSAGGGNNAVNANSFDTAWRQAFEAGLRVWKLLDYWDVGEEIVIILFWGSALVACIVAFAIWFLSHVILGLFIIIGPLVLGLVLFPATKAIFERWIGAMISCVILQVITIILLTLTLQVEDAIIQKILLYRGPNQFEQLRTLLSGMIFFVFAGLIAFQLPGFATALAGGLHFHTGAIARGLGAGASRMGRAAGAAAKVADAGINRGATAIRQRIRPSTGGSLSRSSPPPAE